MRRFIHKTLFLVSSFLALILLLIIFLSIIIEDRATFKLDQNITHIVMGHSHSETAINDSLTMNSTNVSESGEAYFYTYIKLKKLIQ